MTAAPPPSQPRRIATRTFEDLLAWQKARILTREVYRFARRGAFARDFGLADQIRRAAASTMAKLAEGFERGRRREFHQFLSTAKASCAEVRSHLYIALDAGYLSRAEFEELKSRAEEVVRIVGKLRAVVARASAMPGPRVNSGPTLSALSPFLSVLTPHSLLRTPHFITLPACRPCPRFGAT